MTEGGCVVAPTGKQRKLNQANRRYLVFSLRFSGRTSTVKVHQLAAYQKFGEAFLEAQCVRHLDGDSNNNALGNIAIGTFSDNFRDIPPETRKRLARHANRYAMIANRKLTDAMVASLMKDRTLGLKLRELAVKYGISRTTVSKTIKDNR